MDELERQNLALLNQERAEEEETEAAASTQTGDSSRPNFVVYIFLLPIAVVGDLLGLIPVLGAVLRFPFAMVIWLWRLLSGNFKKSPAQKIITSAITGATPLPANTTFVASCYLEETKLGKFILNKATKLTKVIK